MFGWIKKVGKFLYSGAGAGLATVAVGALTGQPQLMVMGGQVAAGGIVKKISKAAGRGVHRVLSPAASLAVVVGANALGMDLPVELAMAGPGAGGAVVELFLNGALGTGIHGTVNSARKTTRDWKERKSW